MIFSANKERKLDVLDDSRSNTVFATEKYDKERKVSQLVLTIENIMLIILEIQTENPINSTSTCIFYILNLCADRLLIECSPTSYFWWRV